MSSTPPARRCLVTGGAGFIGSHLLEHLAAQGAQAVVIDNLSTGRRENLAPVEPGRVTLIEGSVADELPRLAAGDFDQIFHLAAAVGVRLVIDQPVQTIKTNVLDTMAVLEFASREAVPTLIASTSEVYGKSSKTPFAEDDDVTYGPTIYSRWSYACSKAIDEYLALAYAAEKNLPVVVARFFNTVGPRQVGNYGMVIPRFVEAALAGRPLEVHGDGLQSRCFCDVRDMVGVLPQLLRDRTCHGRVFNIGNDEPIEIRALAELVIETLNSNSQIQMIPYDEAFGSGFDDLRHRRPDLSRLRESVVFEATIPLRQTIIDLADSLQPSANSPTGQAAS